MPVQDQPAPVPAIDGFDSAPPPPGARDYMKSIIGWDQEYAKLIEDDDDYLVVYRTVQAFLAMWMQKATIKPGTGFRLNVIGPDGNEKNYDDIRRVIYITDPLLKKFLQSINFQKNKPIFINAITLFIDYLFSDLNSCVGCLAHGGEEREEHMRSITVYWHDILSLQKKLGDFFNIDTRAGFILEMKRILLVRTKRSWIKYEKNLITNNKNIEITIKLTKDKFLSFCEFIMCVLQACRMRNPDYIKFFSEFDFEDGSNYKLAQQIIRLLHSPGLSASELGVPFLWRYSLPDSLDAKLNYLVQKIAHTEMRRLMCELVGEYLDRKKKAELINLKKPFFISISILSCKNLQLRMVEEMCEYNNIKNDPDVQYVMAVLKKCSEYSNDEPWICIESFFNKIEKECGGSGVRRDDFVESALRKVMARYWGEKVGAKNIVRVVNHNNLEKLLKHPFCEDNDLKKVQADNDHLKLELEKQQNILGSNVNSYDFSKKEKDSELFYISTAISHVNDAAVIIEFLKKLHNLESCGAFVSIGDFDECISKLSSKNTKYLSSLQQLKKSCEDDVQGVLDEAIKDHKNSRGCSLFDSLENILNKKTALSFCGSLVNNTLGRWPSAKVAYIRSLVETEDFKRANEVVLFFKPLPTAFSSIQKPQQALSAIETISQPALNAYCIILMQKAAADAHKKWVSEIKSLQSKKEFFESYMSAKPYAVYLQKVDPYKAEWHEVMAKLCPLLEVAKHADSQAYLRYLHLLDTEYLSTWPAHPKKSARWAAHCLWQRLRYEAHVTHVDLKALALNVQHMFTPGSPQDYKRIRAIISIIQQDAFDAFCEPLRGQVEGGDHQTRCKSLATHLVDADLRKTVYTFIDTVFQHHSFCKKVTPHGISPRLEAPTVLQFSHLAKQCLRGMPSVVTFADHGLNLISHLASSTAPSTGSFLHVFYNPKKTYPLLQPRKIDPVRKPEDAQTNQAEILPIRDNSISGITQSDDVDPLPQPEKIETNQAEILELRDKIISSITYPDKGVVQRLSFFCVPIDLPWRPATLQKLKKYIQDYSVAQCSEPESLKLHVIALQRIVSQQEPEDYYDGLLDPRTRTKATKACYKRIDDSLSKLWDLLFWTPLLPSENAPTI